MTPPRDPEATRRQILEIAAQEMWQKGFQNASLAEILEGAGVSKGALYHHFKNKQELGYAVFDEIYTAEFLDKWNFKREDGDDPLLLLREKLLEMIDCVPEEELKLGCPIGNIAMEMAAIDDGFCEKTIQMYSKVTDQIEALLDDAREKNLLKEGVKPAAIAVFVSAAIQGMTAQAKYIRSFEIFTSSLEAMADYIESLRLK